MWFLFVILENCLGVLSKVLFFIFLVNVLFMIYFGKWLSVCLIGIVCFFMVLDWICVFSFLKVKYLLREKFLDVVWIRWDIWVGYLSFLLIMIVSVFI